MQRCNDMLVEVMDKASQSEQLEVSRIKPNLTSTTTTPIEMLEEHFNTVIYVAAA